MLTDAEMILGVSRHLADYGPGAEKAALAQLEFAGHILELAVRLHGSAVSSENRVLALAQDAGIGVYVVKKQLLPVLTTLEWVEPREGAGGTPVWVEKVPAFSKLFSEAARLLDLVLATPVERAALRILSETTRMPLTPSAAIEAVGAPAPVTERALGVLSALDLVARQQSADGHEVIFNPNIWSIDESLCKAALKAEDDVVRTNVGALLEEVTQSPGMPETAVKSAEQRWIDFAVAHGLVQRTLVVTVKGRQQAFLFTPHLGKSTFRHETGADPSGHVRQLIGSMVYASTFASYRLRDPGLFLRRLIRDGEAGDASSIRTDYPMLETAGIVRVEPGARYSKLVLLQSQIAEEAEEYLTAASGVGAADQSWRSLAGQSQYVGPERELGRAARAEKQAARSTSEMEKLLGALRETAGGWDHRE